MFEMPKFDNKRFRFLHTTEAELLVSALHQRSPLWSDITLFALSTGLRASEIFHLQKHHVDFNHTVMHVVDTKNSQNRVVPLNEDALHVMHKNYDNSKSNYVFSYSNEDMPIPAVSRTFPRVVKALRLNDGVRDRRGMIVFHSLRHTFASWLAQAGTPLMIVGSLLGHKTMAMTQRYAHLLPSQAREAVQNLPSLGSVAKGV